MKFKRHNDKKSLFFINKNFDKFFEIRMFIKLNVRNVFHKIRIKNKNKWKTTFKCCFEHYQYRMIFFDLMNASASFQIYINKFLHLFLNIFVFVYLNNILIYTKNEREYVNGKKLIKKHISQIKSIIKKLKKFKLYVKFNKCCFHTKKIFFLNFKIFSTNISMQKNWIFIVQNWLMFCFHKNVQIFINFINFYRRFVNEFFRITANLIDLF